MRDERAPIWRKSSRSGSSGGHCVEVAAAGGEVWIRDSKDPAGPRLVIPGLGWERFLEGIRAGAFGPPSVG